MADLSLPVSRCPGIDAVAREVLGLNPWGHGGTGSSNRAWWVTTAEVSHRAIPLHVPAGRLVAETWLVSGLIDAASLSVEDLCDACLDYGDLLLTLQGDPEAVDIQSVDDMGTWQIRTIGGKFWLFGIDNYPEDGVWDIDALAEADSPRAALDAICREVCGG